MLTNIEVILFSGVILLLPLAVYSLLQGSPPPQIGFFAKFYRAERYLNIVGNVFLLSLCATAIVKLGIHFGYIAGSLAGDLDMWTGIIFMTLLVVFLALWVRAALKVRRISGAGP